FIEMLDGAGRRRFVRVDHDRKPRNARCRRGAHGDAAHGKISPPDQADGTSESQKAILDQDCDGLNRGHAGTSRGAGTGAGAPSFSMGSESEAPGGIIGKTFASCSITNSTSAGPGWAIAALRASSTWSPVSTRRPERR